jgi:hypothetical protein
MARIEGVDLPHKRVEIGFTYILALSPAPTGYSIPFG